MFTPTSSMEASHHTSKATLTSENVPAAAHSSPTTHRGFVSALHKNDACTFQTQAQAHERTGEEGYLLQLAALQGNSGAGAVAGQANFLLALGAGLRVAGQRAGVLAGARPLTWQLALPAVLSRPLCLHGNNPSACKLHAHQS